MKREGEMERGREGRKEQRRWRGRSTGGLGSGGDGGGESTKWGGGCRRGSSVNTLLGWLVW